MTLIIEPVTDTISLIVGKKKGQFPWSNSFLIQGSETVLIDTGCGIENLQALEERYSIDYVINSHCHPDHSAGNWIFARLPLHVPGECADSHGRMGPLSLRLTEPGKLAETWKNFVVEAMDFQDSVPTHFYRDGDEFDFENIRLQAVLTKREHQLISFLENGATFADILATAPFYGSRPYQPELLTYWEGQMIQKHLDEIKIQSPH